MAGLNLIAAAPEVIPPGQQIDLFVESLVSAPLRDDRATMEFPFFALQKAPPPHPDHTVSFVEYDRLVHATGCVPSLMMAGRLCYRHTRPRRASPKSGWWSG